MEVREWRREVTFYCSMQEPGKTNLFQTHFCQLKSVRHARFSAYCPLRRQKATASAPPFLFAGQLMVQESTRWFVKLQEVTEAAWPRLRLQVLWLVTGDKEKGFGYPMEQHESHIRFGVSREQNCNTEHGQQAYLSANTWTPSHCQIERYRNQKDWMLSKCAWQQDCNRIYGCTVYTQHLITGLCEGSCSISVQFPVGRFPQKSPYDTADTNWILFKLFRREAKAWTSWKQN